MKYTVDLVREPNAIDDMVVVGGAKVFVNPQATLFLLGTEMDFEVSKEKTPDRLRLQKSQPDVGLRLRQVGERSGRAPPELLLPRRAAERRETGR